MSRKKKKISPFFTGQRFNLSMVVVLFVVTMLTSYQLGVHKGKNLALHADMDSLGQQQRPKVEKLTFFDSLHAPMANKSLNKKTVVEKKVQVLPKVPAGQASMQEGAQVVAPTEIATTKSPDEQESRAPKISQPAAPEKADLPPQKAVVAKASPQKSYSHKLSVGQRKKQPWAVQVGAFEDGVKAVLLRKELEKKGFAAYTLTIRHQDLEIYRVIVASSSEEMAEKIHTGLQKDGYSAAFVIKKEAR